MRRRLQARQTYVSYTLSDAVGLLPTTYMWLCTQHNSVEWQ